MKTRLQNLMSIGMLFVATFSFSQTTVVSSLAALRSAVQNSNQEIVLTPGNYNIGSLPSNQRYFDCTGSNNTIDLTGVYIEFPVAASNDQHFLITGSNNTIRGGVLENTYPSGITEVTDYVAYNNDKTNFANGGDPHVVIQGDNNSIIGIKMIVRGSFPYGYGSMYGINADNKFGLSKRGGIAVQGTNVIIDSCELQMQAFGHGIYIQSPSNHTIIRNTTVIGDVRLGSEILAETDPSSLPYRSGFQDFGDDYENPVPIDPNRGISLCEDGIRLYSNGGSMQVENCRVEKMRGGIRGYLGSGTTVVNSTAIDCESTNFNLPNGGTITNSYGNFAYSPLSDYRLSRSNTTVEWTIIPSPHATGPHNIADIQGDNHKIVFHRTPGPIDTTTRAIVVTGSNSTIVNETEYAIVFESTATGNTLVSCGGASITNNGTNNTITEFDSCEEAQEYANTLCPKTAELMEAECYDAMSGIRTENTGDTGGGLNIGYIENNDWIQFDDIDISGMNSINARNSGKSNGSTIEVRLDAIDGDLIATIPVTNTGGWQNWVTNSVDLENSVEGIHDVFFVFKSTSTGSVFNVNWLGFSSEQLSTKLNSLNDHGVHISPNPIKNEFNIDLSNASFTGDVNVCIYSVKGEILLQTKVSSINTTRLDVSNLSSGVYFLRVHDQNKVITGKVIKK